MGFSTVVPFSFASFLLGTQKKRKKDHLKEGELPEVLKNGLSLYFPIR